MPAPWERDRCSRQFMATGLIVGIGIVLLWLLFPQAASAHAHLVQADPAPGSVLAQVPAVGQFYFDEPLNPALTRVRVTNANGQLVTTSGESLAPGHNNELWLVPLPHLAAGTYSVFWTSESATDGHVMSSFYTFQISSAGGAGSVGAVTGSAGGTYGGASSSSSGGVALPTGNSLATALIHWLSLLFQALWLGCLLVELLVLAPARRTAKHPMTLLAWEATEDLWLIARLSVVLTALALGGEVISLALEGTQNDWASALNPTTIAGILSSQNGHLVVARIAVLLGALAVSLAADAPAIPQGDPAITRTGMAAKARSRPDAPSIPRTEPATAKIAAPSGSARNSGQPIPQTEPTATTLEWRMARPAMTVLALLYMFLVALSGHAANVTPGWLSYTIDWLHLVCTAAWAGGIVVLAWIVLPSRHLLPPRERATAVLFLVDRFSPVAYSAVIILSLSGLYNAINHLSNASLLITNIYGQLLDIKVVLVGLMVLLSASHVYGLRPRIARWQALAVPSLPTPASPRQARWQRKAKAPQPANIPIEQQQEQIAQATAEVHEGLATLAARLRMEGGIGAAILLVTALMSQTLPPDTTATSAASGLATTLTIPTTISGTASKGTIRASLTVAPPAVGTATFTVDLRQGTTTLTGDTAAVIMHLYPATTPNSQATLDPTASGSQFRARGSLAATGLWRADVLVRTAQLPDYLTIPFTFTVGPGAAFISAGENRSGVSIQVTPGLLSAPNTFTLSGLHAPAVRVLSQSLDMYMGILPYTAVSLGGGRWQISNAFAPMNGRWGLTVQIQSAQGGAWTTIQQFVYQVPLSGLMTLLTAQASSPPATTGGTPPGSSTATANARIRINGPYNVAFARSLPYQVLVTEMGSNGVRVLNGPLLPTGVQAHGVDVLDGTPYAYITNFGAVPGTVSQINIHTMRVVRTYTVGLGPAHIIFTPNQKRAFVTDFRSGDLTEIDLTTGRTHTITFPNDTCFEPHGGDISEDGRTLYVACAGGAWIYTVNTATLQPDKPVLTAPGAYGVAVDAPRHEVWVTNQTVNNVTVLDERTLRTLATIPVGKGPALLVATPNGKTVYVADQQGNAVSVIDAAHRRIITTIRVAAQPHGPDVTKDGKYVYIASIGGNAVTIIRTSDNAVVAVVPAPVGSNEAAVNNG